MDITGTPGRTNDSLCFTELSVVSFRHDVKHGDRTIPRGTSATIVAAYADGVGYEVEIFTPFHAVVTVKAGDLAK